MKNKTLSKFLSALLAVAIVLCSAPLSGFVGIDLPDLFSINAEAKTYSGTCGESAYWSLNTETGVLNITGKGNMDITFGNSNGYSLYDAYSVPDMPWSEYVPLIKKVNIDYGISNVCDFAFYGCENLTSVTISGSVISIGRFSFAYCESLKSINLPSSVKSIGSSAFEICENLVSVYMADGVETIGVAAFYGCKSLETVTLSKTTISIGMGAFSFCESLASVTIPASVTSIEDSVFNRCTSLKEINVNANNKNYSSDDYGVLYDKNKTMLIQYPQGNIRTTFTVPNSVTSIKESAFSVCKNLTSVTIGKSVKNIGEYAFYECTNLTSITIPAGVTSIDSYAFYDCTSLVDVYYTGDVESWCNISFEDSYANPMCYAKNLYINNILVDEVVIPNTVSEIKNYAFYNVQGITSVAIPAGVKNIGDKAFYNCENLTSVTIPDSITAIGDLAFYNTAFYNDSVNWENDVLYIGNQLIKAKSTLSGSYSVKSGTKAIAGGAFEDCINIISVMIPDSVTTIGDSAFYNCQSLTSVTIGNRVTSIGEYVFYNCESLTSITIPDSITSIGAYALSSCENLTSVTIGNGVTTIGSHAFYYCTSLASVAIPNSVINIGESAFSSCDSLTSVAIPNSVISVGESAFSFCGSLTLVTIGKCVETIGDGAFRYCDDLNAINVDANNKNYSSDSYGALYNKNKTILIQYPTGNSRKMFTIPNSVTSIEGYAFYNCQSLTSVTIGNRVTSIGDYAFYGCESLTSITIPDSITSIDNDAFVSCENLKDVYYNGTEEKWDKIGIAKEGNDPLFNATIHFLGENHSHEHKPGEWENDGKNKEVQKCLECKNVISTRVKETESGISLEYDQGVYNEEITVEVVKAEEGSSVVEIATNNAKGAKAFVYDIVTKTKDGKIVQPNGDVLIKIPLDNSWQYESIKVYYVNEKTGLKEEIASECIGGYVIFKTNHFSYYAVVELKGIVNAVKVNDFMMNYKSSVSIENSVELELDGKPDYEITYSTSNPDVITVDENGNATAIGTGETLITVTVTDEYGNVVEDTCKVTVSYAWWQWLIRIFLLGFLWY